MSKIIGYTAGVFDLFHIGHLNLIKKAKENCDFLIVGVNSDELVKEYKNKTPIIPEEERLEIIKSLKSVDKAVLVNTRDKLDAYNKYKFNRIFVGDDWKKHPSYIEAAKKLEPYKESIENSDKTIHEMITLSSIVEKEGANDSDRKMIAGVFYNRLRDGWSLGSDPTTYYAEKIDDNVRGLKMSELNSCNAYNTRSSCLNGKLPVGPICNPGLASLVASIEPEKHNYYYFVADKNGKNYFNETQAGHDSTINKLKREGLWITY